MATEVPFHSAFTDGFLKEAESEARTAICTKLGLEELTSTPHFTFKLYSIRARKFIADTFFPANDNEAEDLPTDSKKSNLGVCKVVLTVLMLTALLWASKQPSSESVAWIKESLFSRDARSSLDSIVTGDHQASKSVGEKLPVPSPVPHVTGWCHPAHLWPTAPRCGLQTGVWDMAPRLLISPAVSTRDPLHLALVRELTSTVQRIADIVPQQEQVNNYVYHAINDIKQEVTEMKHEIKDVKAETTVTAAVADAKAAEEKPSLPSSSISNSDMISTGVAVLCIVVIAVTWRQNSLHQANMQQIIQQNQHLQEQVACLRVLPEKMNDMENQLKRQQKQAVEARADNHQLHEDLREKLDVSVQDMNMTQSQLAGLLAALSSDVRFLKSEAHNDMSRFREAINQLEVEREALHSEIEARDQQIEDVNKQLTACFVQLEGMNQQLQDTTEKLQTREEGFAEMTMLVNNLQEELQEADAVIAAKAAKVEELKEQLEVETKARTANEGYVDILRDQHDILTKAVLSMNEYLDADENMRIALEGRVADLETERNNLMSQLSHAKDAEQQALHNADKYRKEVTEKEKLLHYRKYEMEMLMKMAKENNSARSVTSSAGN